ncbi:putative secreted protein [Cryptosporidium canis]|uniref:Secreted protein n=1 Tax=Cryptosporidium canis TaxID=195482 RepID=A0A9D5DLR3_9CRYT|nr:putative secreted protein [Cryptosporidium canis]
MRKLERLFKKKNLQENLKKKRKQVERRARGILEEQDQDMMDEKQGVGEADNESQIKYDNSKEGSDDQKCSIKTIEEKDDGKSYVVKLIIPVLKIVEETISHDSLKQDEVHGEKYKEKSKGVCSENYSTKSTGKKRRAYEVPTGAPLVRSTASLFGKDAQFETRRSGKTRDISSERSKCSYMDHNKSDSSLDSARSLESASGSSSSTNIHTPRHRVRTICKSSSRKLRSRSRNKDGSSKRATSTKKSRSLSIPRTKSRPSIRTRSNSLPRARSRHGSNTNFDPRYGTSSKGDSMTNLVNKFIKLEKDVSELYSGPQEVQSRFIPMFSKSKSSDSLQNFDIFSFFSIHAQDFSHINENSSLEEIENSVELCATEITRIHLEIIPLLSGYDLLTLKIFLKDMISQFIKLLILMNNKKKRKHLKL